MKMENENNLYESFASILRHVEETKPLIHCITHPITMNDCANLVLAVGASPNMRLTRRKRRNSWHLLPYWP